MKASRMKAFRILRKAGLVLPLLGFGLGGCLFGENRQFFSERAVPEVGRPPEPSLGSPQSVSPLPPPSPQGSVRKTDLFRVGAPGRSGIDVLFCIDNSPSMTDNQNILADSFQGFIRGFLSAGLDFHIGIVTSDVDSSSRSVWSARMPDYPGANRGLLLSRDPSEHFLTADSRDLVATFEGNARVGTRGSSREQCLASFVDTLENASKSPSGWNTGFFRADSFHAFVVVSDENEDIQDGESIESRVARLKAGVSSVSGSASRGSRFDFIVNLSASPPAFTPAPGSVQYYPARYLAASSLLSGHNHDISRNFTSDLLSISEGLVRQASEEFTLSGTPLNPQSLQVTLNGMRVAEDSRNGYVFHPERNSIELVGSVIASAVGKQLQASYLVQIR